MCSCFYQVSQLHRNASTLVIAEHDGETVIPITYNTITAAKELGSDLSVLVAGPDCSKITQELGQAAGVSKILVAEKDSYEGFLPEALTPLLLDVQEKYKFTHILVGAGAFGKVHVMLHSFYMYV